MKHYSISNIYIDYDGIRCERYVSKNRLKKVTYNFIYSLTPTFLRLMTVNNIKVSVYWHYGWNEPVVYIPGFDGFVDILHGLGKELGWGEYNESNL